MRSLWQRLPVVVRAVLAGAALTTVGTVPWALLASANLRYLPAVPWALVPAALHLWLFWRWARGDGWPRSTAAARRATLRANALPDDVWAAALLAGMLGLGAVLLVGEVTSRLAPFREAGLSGLERAPTVTVLFLLVMGALVAGVVEETAFRGYLQRPIERRHGPAVAILVTGVVFGLAHFTHAEVTAAYLPYYLAVAAVYGGLAWLTDSILPGLVLHAGGNLLLGLFTVLGRGAATSPAPAPAPTVWETGPDAAFWGAVVGLVVVGAAAVSAFAALAGLTRGTRAAREPAPGTA